MIVDDWVIFPDGASRELTDEEKERYAEGKLRRIRRNGAAHPNAPSYVFAPTPQRPLTP